MEPVVGPTGQEIELSFQYRFRGTGGEQQSPIRLESTNNVTVANQALVVVQSATMTPSSKDTHTPQERALVVHATVIDSTGNPLHSPSFFSNKTDPETR